MKTLSVLSNIPVTSSTKRTNTVPGLKLLTAQRRQQKRINKKFFLAAPSCPTLCDRMHCGPLGSSVCEILQARISELVAIVFSSGSSRPRDQTWPPELQADSLPSEPAEKPLQRKRSHKQRVISVLQFWCVMDRILPTWVLWVQAKEIDSG